MTLARLLDRGERWLFDRKKATYGLSAMRICMGVAILGSLVVNFADRHYVWGPGARWLSPWLVVDDWGFPFTVIFGDGDSTVAFTLKYLVLGMVTVLFTLGWRTRFVTPVLLLMLASLMRLNPIANDAGDNLVRISLLFMCFGDVSAHWSLDARRSGVRSRARLRMWRARPSTSSGVSNGELRSRLGWPSWPGVLFHNVALMAVASQVFIVYGVSGLSKVQGSMWQEGVGLYYPLQIDQYASWPGLNELVYTNGFVVTIGSYVTVFAQVFFPLLLMRRLTRAAALIVMFGLHVGIAVTMALPWFSLAILAADAIFIRDVTYRSFIDRLRRLRSRGGEVAERAESAPEKGAGVSISTANRGLSGVTRE